MIDLIGYRRLGHNETDEPAYTQPLMYEEIKNHPPVRKIYADALVKEGLVDRGGGRRADARRARASSRRRTRK